MLIRLLQMDILLRNNILIRSIRHAHALHVTFEKDNRRKPSANEPPHGKTQQSAFAKTKTQISFAVTAKLISAFVFAPWIVQFLFYLNPKFLASSSFLCLYRSVCVGPVRKPHCCFSHEAAQMFTKQLSCHERSSGSIKAIALSRVCIYLSFELIQYDQVCLLYKYGQEQIRYYWEPPWQ